VDGSDLRGGTSQGTFKVVVSKLEAIVEELKTLPPQRLEQAADYIHRLHAGGRLERKAALRRTAGSLTNEEADEMARIIEEGCEQIDERDW
jgi:hypothetical protein